MQRPILECCSLTFPSVHEILTECAVRLDVVTVANDEVHRNIERVLDVIFDARVR